MPIVFPTVLPANTKNVLGKPEVFIANYVTAGADPGGTGANIFWLGSLEDGVTQSGGPEYEQLMGGQDVLGPIDSVISKDSRTFKFTMRDLDHLAMGIIDGGYGTISAPNTITALSNLGISSVPANGHQKAEGGLYGTSTAGDLCAPYWQVIIRTPNFGSVTCPRYIGFRQFFKCIIRRAGDEVFRRTEHTKIAVEVVAHWDASVTIAKADAATGTATGAFGRTHFAQAYA